MNRLLKRQKLLAGRVPDVPMTVDAKIPDDDDKTIRERFAVTAAPARMRLRDDAMTCSVDHLSVRILQLGLKWRSGNL